MRSVREWDKSDLDQIVQADQKETTTIDYKASSSLSFKDRRQQSDGRGTVGDKHRDDLIRDVASMANAEGGLIIYAIAERRGGYPDHIDGGVDPRTVTAEQIEQIILTNINLRVEGFFVQPIELDSGNRTFVISIPKAQKNAPHQSDDMLYHRRRDATTLVMEDNEIRDMMGRSLEFGRKFGIAWDLQVEMRRIVEAAKARQEIAEGGEASRQTLVISISPSLRSSGVAVMALPRPLRAKAAALIGYVDRYNSLVETIDPGMGDVARLTGPMRSLLGSVEQQGNDIVDGLVSVLEDQP